VPHVVKVFFSGGVEVVHHHQEVVDSMVAVGVEISSASPRTNSLHANSVGRLITQYSSVSRGLIQIIREKKRVNDVASYGVCTN
jgi:hypothetical protein